MATILIVNIFIIVRSNIVAVLLWWKDKYKKQCLLNKIVKLDGDTTWIGVDICQADSITQNFCVTEFPQKSIEKKPLITLKLHATSKFHLHEAVKQIGKIISCFQHLASFYKSSGIVNVVLLNFFDYLLISKHISTFAIAYFLKETYLNHKYFPKKMSWLVEHLFMLFYQIDILSD